MKRLLALDGGGIRGVFSLQILARIEACLRTKTGNPQLVLSEYFDYMAGTSTGAIIATCLAWGMSVDEIQRLYTNRAIEMFHAAPVYRRFWNKFEADAIINMFKVLFSEDGEGKVPSLLGTKKLRTLLAVVMRNHSTGSPWPISNNPAAEFNDPASPECNLKLPLWQLVRASTAAPVYFPPETIQLGRRKQVFVDGGITPYNNPALLLFLMASLPTYKLGWETGVDKMLLVSIGTGRVETGIGSRAAKRMNMLFHARSIPDALMEAINQEQDLICRTIGFCKVGEPIDSEIGDLRDLPAEEMSRRKFSYLRYDHAYTPEDYELAKKYGKGGISLDNIRLIPLLQHLGRDYADQHVLSEDLL
jgi:patatin-like phospholipase/acyl hydrolase